MSLGYWETLASISADGPALTAAARASALASAGALYGRWVMPGNKLRVGDVLRLRASGRISCAVTTPGTARFDLSLGAAGTALMDTLAMPLNIVVQNNVPWFLDMEGIVRSIGNAGTMFWQGLWASTASLNVAAPGTGPWAGVVPVPYNVAPVVGAAFDMTAQAIIDFNFTQTVATGSLTVHNYSLSLMTSTGF